MREGRRGGFGAGEKGEGLGGRGVRMAMDGSENHVRAATGTGTPEQIDVENYASLYTGHTKIARLHFMADHCNSRNLELEALRMSLDEIKKGDNTMLFKECVEKINGRLGPGYGLDQEWIDTVERRAAQRQEKLEMELNGYKVPFLVLLSGERVFRA